MKIFFFLKSTIFRSKKIIILVSVLILGYILLFSIHPFLAITKPVSCEILVVEGWLPDSFLEIAATEFKHGNYKKLITIGGPIEDGSLQNDYTTVAERAKKIISDFGIANKFIFPVPYLKKTKHRTFNSFLALRKWLSNSNVKALNIFTGGVHARKSYVLCKKVLGEKIKIGVIAAPPLLYNPKYWWLSTRGIKLIIKNTIGYFYALFFTSKLI